MGIWTKLAVHQMKVRATTQPNCIGDLRKLADGESNWDYYVNRRGICYSVAKPNSGCDTTYYGDLRYVSKALREGWIKKYQLTKLGRRLLSAYHY